MVSVVGQEATRHSPGKNTGLSRGGQNTSVRNSGRTVSINFASSPAEPRRIWGVFTGPMPRP